MRFHLRKRLIVMLTLAMMFALWLALAWAWTEYLSWVKRVPLRPMPVPTPPGI
jgi:hypothetical protein